jgi:stage III sporulation protein SpoIIIAA
VDEIDKRSEMLKKLFAANKGISKLTGADPESIEEMMKNPDLYSMTNGDVDTKPRGNLITLKILLKSR